MLLLLRVATIFGSVFVLNLAIKRPAAVDAAKTCKWSNATGTPKCGMNVLAVAHDTAFATKQYTCTTKKNKGDCLGTASNNCMWHAVKNKCSLMQRFKGWGPQSEGTNQLMDAKCPTHKNATACTTQVYVPEKMPTTKCVWVMRQYPKPFLCTYNLYDLETSAPGDNGTMALNYLDEMNYCLQFLNTPNPSPCDANPRCKWKVDADFPVTHSKCTINTKGTLFAASSKAFGLMTSCGVHTTRTACYKEPNVCQMDCAVPCVFKSGKLSNSKKCTCSGGAAGGHSGGKGADSECTAKSFCLEGKAGTATTAAGKGKCSKLSNGAAYLGPASFASVLANVIFGFVYLSL